MKSSGTLKLGLAKVQRQSQAGRYDKALALLDELLPAWPNHPPLLVRRAELLQLQEDRDASSLKEAKAALHQALELDPESPPVLIELGHYYYAVEDDAKTGADYFEKAITLCKQLLKEALLGQADALAELEQRENALASLAEAYWLGSHNGKSRNGQEILSRLDALR
jgi:tetratricopeptide (TPR) repeat protein